MELRITQSSTLSTTAKNIIVYYPSSHNAYNYIATIQRIQHCTITAEIGHCHMLLVTIACCIVRACPSVTNHQHEHFKSCVGDRSKILKCNNDVQIRPVLKPYYSNT